MTETERDRRSLLAEAQLLGIDLLAIGTKHPDGAVTLDWDVLQKSVDEEGINETARRAA